MIYFSYGMTKSASSFVYQLQEQIIKNSNYNLVKVPTEIRNNNARENYLEPITDEKVQQILEWLPENSVTVIKTHGSPSPLAIKLVQEGKAWASATYRDPREIAISLLDHGKRSRDKGIPDFANFQKPLDTLKELEIQIANRFTPWKNTPNCLAINYNLTKSKPESLVKILLEQMNLKNINTEDILLPFEDKSKIIHFNIGENDRYKKIMDTEDLNIFNKHFESFINYCNK